MLDGEQGLSKYIYILYSAVIFLEELFLILEKGALILE